MSFVPLGEPNSIWFDSSQIMLNETRVTEDPKVPLIETVEKVYYWLYLDAERYNNRQ